MINNDIQYIQAYTEINCLLKHFPKEYLDKIPSKLLTMFKTKSNDAYNIDVDLSKDLKSQNISKKTRDILAVLKYNYWSTDVEQQQFKEKFYENEKIYQEELSKKYNTDNLFKNKTKSNENIITENVALVTYKEPFFRKILNKIKSFFHK